jgi:hypothetical protein
MSNDPSQSAAEIDPQRLRVLQAVLERALLDADASSTALLDDVREVAARNAGAELSFDPIAVEVVQRMICRRLGVRLGNARGESSPLHRLATEVAATLWDHPESRRRLERLWADVAGTEAMS